ncbi:MAG: hypothetical protein KKB50_11660 [Planctomycetes bacterium]|nr:hypothetical protein [Planctomycetota bacterium]
MRKTTTRSNSLDELVAALQSGICDEATARRLCQLGPHAVTLALLSAARRIAEQDARIAELQMQNRHASPSTPSGMMPVYSKPNLDGSHTAAGCRRKRAAARKGHPGHRRPTPTRIDARKEQRQRLQLSGVAADYVAPEFPLRSRGRRRAHPLMCRR